MAHKCIRGLASLLLVLLLMVSPAAAESVTDLPPRPNLPTPMPAPRYSSGAAIRLTVSPASPMLWTVVQWQDAAAGWHDVDGWRGLLDNPNEGTKTWWVNATDMGRGPFRWVVLDGPDGAPLAASEPFMLPSVTRQVGEVRVTLP